MRLDVDGTTVELEPELVIVAGFTGSGLEAVRAHVEELAAQGVTPPEHIPSFYVVAPSALVQADTVTTVHPATSGEAEIALAFDGDEVYVTLASDHTDRAAETVDLALSKQVCPKVVASRAWRREDVGADWNTLEIRSWIEQDGARTIYQSGTARELLHPDDLLPLLRFRTRPRSYVLLLGTVPARGGIRASGRFWAELGHPRRNRTLTLDYRVEVLAGLDPPAGADGRPGGLVAR